MNKKDSYNQASIAENMTVDPNDFNLWSLLVKKFIIAFFAVLTEVWLLFELSNWVLKTNFGAGTGILGAVVITLIAALLAIIYVFVFLINNAKKGNFKTDNNTELQHVFIEKIESAYADKNWEEVIKIGSVLSRPLWVTGNYLLRLRFGKLLEAAAAYKGDYTIQASCLIDDIGWTNHAMNNTEIALKNIKHGVEISKSQNLFFLAYKGYRHLSAIEAERGNLIEAGDCYSNSLFYAKKINKPDLFPEIKAGLHVLKSVIERKKNNLQEALNEIECARKIHHETGDIDREVKTYHYRGDILVEMGNINEAKDVYRKGLTISRQASRRDGIMHNSIGIARIAMKLGDIEEAKGALEEASKTASELGKDFLARELKIEASNL